MEAYGRGGPDRARRVIALAVGGLAVVLSLIGTALLLVSSGQAADRVGLISSETVIWRVAAVVLQVDLVLLLAVAILICVRLPSHAVGWSLLASGALFAIAVVTGGYVLVAYSEDPVRLPAADLAAWFNNWSWGPAFALLAVALFLFPTGRSISTAWSRGFGALLAALTGAMALNSVYPGPLPQTLGVENVAGLSIVGGIPQNAAQWSAGATIASVLAVGAGSMVVRYRRSTAVEQVQLRWVVGASALVAMAFLVLAMRGPWDAVDDLVWYLMLAMVPVAIGIAILRYRLYAIDVIIRRTLIYGALSLVLAACYALTVLVLQPLLTGFAGEDWVVVSCGTLAVAAAFRPFRGRIQAVIDRHFFRVHYDSAQTATALAQRLRGEVELDVIEADLVATVSETMQPSRIGLWQRG
jgi:hypothetical protein